MRKFLKRIIAAVTALSIIVISLVSAFAVQENNENSTAISVNEDSCEHLQCVWVINVPSACTTAGEEAQTCTSCQSVIETREIPATEHDDGVWTVSIEATCFENGEEILTCTSCGKVIDTRVISATGHDEGIWKIDFEPAPEHEGQMSRYCSKCDVVLETKSFSAHDHNEGYRKTITQPTCANDGTGGIFCVICGSKYDSYVVPALGHIYSEWYMNNDSTHSRTCSRCKHNERNSCTFTSSTYHPTCTEGGYAEHICDICTYTIVEHYEPLGHDWSHWVEDVGNDTHTRYCQRHGCEATETQSHNWSEWIYKDKQKDNFSYEYLMMRRCYDCGAVQEKTVQQKSSEGPILLIIGGTVIGATVTGIVAAWNAAITTASVVGGVSAIWLFVKYLLPELQKLHSVTYRVDGEIYKYYVVKEGEPVPVPEDPEAPGRVFAGWEPEVPEIMPGHDLVFDAKWEEAEKEEAAVEETVDAIIPETGSTVSKTFAASAAMGLALAAFTLLKKKKDK